MKKFAVLTAAALAASIAAQPTLARERKAQQQQQQKKEGEPDKNAYEAPFPLKMTWQLSTINGKSPPAEASLLIDDNLRGSGSSGCNTWSAALYPVRNHRLAMGPVAMTKKSCSPEIGNFERLYLTVLHGGPTWDLQGSTLTIKGQGGTLVFNRGL